MHLREDASYRQILIDYARKSDDDFVRFINMVINDLTFFLDESMQALRAIHEYEKWVAEVREELYLRRLTLRTVSVAARSYGDKHRGATFVPTRRLHGERGSGTLLAMEHASSTAHDRFSHKGLPTTVPER